jgi:hypothetical protein
VGWLRIIPNDPVNYWRDKLRLPAGSPHPGDDWTFFCTVREVSSYCPITESDWIDLNGNFTLGRIIDREEATHEEFDIYVRREQ